MELFEMAAKPVKMVRDCVSASVKQMDIIKETL